MTEIPADTLESTRYDEGTDEHLGLLLNRVRHLTPTRLAEAALADILRASPPANLNNSER